MFVLSLWFPAAKETLLLFGKVFAQRFTHTDGQPLPRLMCVVVQLSSCFHCCSFIIRGWVEFSVDRPSKCTTQMNI